MRLIFYAVQLLCEINFALIFCSLQGKNIGLIIELLKKGELIHHILINRINLLQTFIIAHSERS